MFDRNPASFFCTCIHLCQLRLLKKTVLPQLDLSYHVYRKSVDCKYKDLFLDLNSVPLIYTFILMPVPHYIDYCRLIVSFAVGICVSSKFILPFSRLAILCVLHFYMNFRISFSISCKKKQAEMILIEIV